MSDAERDEPIPDEENAILKAMNFAEMKGFGKPKERKRRETVVRKSVDRRSLRATGRTELFTFRCREDVSAMVKRAAKNAGVSVAEFMEQIIENGLRDDNEGTA